MRKKPLWQTVNGNLLSDKARRFFEESDNGGIECLFGNCNTIEEIEETASELYDEFFGEEVCNDYY